MASKLVEFTPGLLSNARVLSGLTSLNYAAADPTRGPSVEEVNSRAAVPSGVTDSSDLVAILIQRNQVIWDKLLNNKFCQDMAKAQKGDATFLKGFTYYTIQDYFYCQELIRYDAERLSKAPTPAELMEGAEHIHNDYLYALSVLDVCTKDLNVTQAQVDSTPKEAANQAYSDFEVQTAEREDWVNSLVAMIPCIQAYYLIAKKMQDQHIATDTIWYKSWVKDNLDPSYALKQSAFFKAFDKDWLSSSAQMADLDKVFTRACQFEIDFFGFGEKGEQSTGK